MKQWMFISFFLYCSNPGCCQQERNNRINQWVDLGLTAGNKEGVASGSYGYIFNWGKHRKWETGIGLRSTNYVGADKDFITAPAKLSRTTTTPFAIVFAGQRTENWDTLTIAHPAISSLNLTLNFGYRLTKKLALGFNIDLIGFSIGKTSAAVLTSNGIAQHEPAARPTGFNLLLTGDNDLGSLNSEFFLRYHLKGHWAIRGIYQFYFAEYTTHTVHQVAPDGTSVYRFRNKANLLGAGLSYHF